MESIWNPYGIHTHKFHSRFEMISSKLYEHAILRYLASPYPQG